jgi:peptide/nickel transport system permease protein
MSQTTETVTPTPAATATTVAVVSEARRKSLAKGFFATGFQRFLNDRISFIALVVFAIIVVFTLLGGVINDSLLHVDPNKSSPFDKFHAAGWVGKGYNAYKEYQVTHWLGTDEQGRDVLGRLLVAGQISLLVGFLTAAIVIVVGGVLGLLAGYYGAWVDDAINALVQILQNVPTFFLLIVLSVIFTPDPVTLSLLLGLTGWTGVTRLVRGTVLSVKNRDYVDAARVMGAGNNRIIFLHILPNALSVLLVSAANAVAGTILAESGLSALGFGVRPPTASWGNMLAGGVSYSTQGYWWLVITPGLLIFATTLCIFLFADGLRDAFDPRLKE